MYKEVDFLQTIIDEEKSTLVFLTNGVKLQGKIVGNDEETIYVQRDGVTQMVYKTAISTVMPSTEKRNYDYNDPNNNGSQW